MSIYLMSIDPPQAPGLPSLYDRRNMHAELGAEEFFEELDDPASCLAVSSSNAELDARNAAAFLVLVWLSGFDASKMTSLAFFPQDEAQALSKLLGRGGVLVADVAAPHPSRPQLLDASRLSTRPHSGEACYDIGDDQAACDLLAVESLWEQLVIRFTPSLAAVFATSGSASLAAMGEGELRKPEILVRVVEEACCGHLSEGEVSTLRWLMADDEGRAHYRAANLLYNIMCGSPRMQPANGCAGIAWKLDVAQRCWELGVGVHERSASSPLDIDAVAAEMRKMARETGLDTSLAAVLDAGVPVEHVAPFDEVGKRRRERSRVLKGR